MKSGNGGAAACRATSPSSIISFFLLLPLHFHRPALLHFHLYAAASHRYHDLAPRMLSAGSASCLPAPPTPQEPPLIPPLAGTLTAPPPSKEEEMTRYVPRRHAAVPAFVDDNEEERMKKGRHVEERRRDGVNEKKKKKYLHLPHALLQHRATAAPALHRPSRLAAAYLAFLHAFAPPAHCCGSAPAFFIFFFAASYRYLPAVKSWFSNEKRRSEEKQAKTIYRCRWRENDGRGRKNGGE